MSLTCLTAENTWIPAYCSAKLREVLSYPTVTSDCFEKGGTGILKVPNGSVSPSKTRMAPTCLLNLNAWVVHELRGAREFSPASRESGVGVGSAIPFHDFNGRHNATGAFETLN